MPRGASYESNANLGNVPLSHNAIETGENQAVGTGTEVRSFLRFVSIQC